MLADILSLSVWYKPHDWYWKRKRLENQIPVRPATDAAWDELADQTSEDYADFLYYAYQGRSSAIANPSILTDVSMQEHIHTGFETISSIKVRYDEQNLMLEMLKAEADALQKMIEFALQLLDKKRRAKWLRRRM
jgi:hypothetical protein